MSKKRKTSEKTQRLNLTDYPIKGLPTKDRDYTVWGQHLALFVDHSV